MAVPDDSPGGAAAGFQVPAEAYNAFMGRFSEPLAESFLALVPVAARARALDVGCGPGALTSRLAERLGPGSVAAVDPAAGFVAAAAARVAGVDVRQAAAEALPFDDASFDLCLAQLVVHFMSDPVAGLREMARVTRTGGTVAACVWDHAGGRGPLSVFWRAVRELDAAAHDESGLPGVREGHLQELFEAAGVPGQAGALTVSSGYASFDEWWTPYTLGVGPAGTYVAGLSDADRERLRRRCAGLLPAAPFEVSATAWYVVATV